MHSVALKSDGTVRAWGGSTHGQAAVPAGLGGVTGIGAGRFHTAVIGSDGKISCWGQDIYGQCAVPTSTPSVTQISAGYSHTAAVRADGTVDCWGSNWNGETTVPSTLGGVIQVAAGFGHTAALTSARTVVCWGDNVNGACNVPAGMANVTQVAAGWGFTVALLEGGAVNSWGNWTTWSVPGDVGVASQVAAGYEHTVVRRATGTVRCWGDNYFGQCNVPGTLVASSAVAGLYHTILLRPDGTVGCWGQNTYGQCDVPPDLQGIVEIGGGAEHTAALRSDGTVACWGSNQFGQAAVPVGLGGVQHIAAGGSTTLAILSAERSGCGNSSGAGTATLSTGGCAWENVGIWTWSNGGGPQVPGAQTDVDFSAYGSVGSTCDARCGTLHAYSGSSLLVPVDLSIPSASQPDHSIDVATTATMAGRIWLLGAAAATLPDDLNVPVLRCNTPIKSFDLIQSNVPAPAGKFLTLVPSMVGSQILYSLSLRNLPGGGATEANSDASASGRAIAAEVIDVNDDGFDDLALAINFSNPQSGLLQILMNDGTGALGTSSQLYPIEGSQLTCLATGDVNGDGLEDAAVGLATGRIHNWRNLGEGDLQNPSSFPTGSDIPISLAIISRSTAGSGLAMQSGGYTSGSTSGGSKVTTFNESGTQTGSISTDGTTPTTMVGRGRDVATGGSSSATLTPALGASGKVAVFRIDSDSKGNPVPTLVQTINIPGSPALMDMADVDGDGFREIITANHAPESLGDAAGTPVLTLMRGSPTGFSAAIPFAPDGASSGEDVSLVDTNNDGVRDIVSVHHTVGATTQAAIIRLAICRDDSGAPCNDLGTTFTVESQTLLSDSTQPSFTVRGDLNGHGGDDFYLVDEPPSSGVAGLVGSTGRPYLGADFCIGDLTHDNAVDGGDLSQLLVVWGLAGEYSADFNRDGVVDGGDLGIMLGSWGFCN